MSDNTPSIIERAEIWIGYDLTSKETIAVIKRKGARTISLSKGNILNILEMMNEFDDRVKRDSIEENVTVDKEVQ